MSNDNSPGGSDQVDVTMRIYRDVTYRLDGTDSEMVEEAMERADAETPDGFSNKVLNAEDVHE